MQWTYDGFGNRLNQMVMAGKTGVPSYMSVDPATNRITTSGFYYDANGNMVGMPNVTGITYDVDNRLKTANGEQYAYDSGNKLRAWRTRGHHYVRGKENSGPRKNRNYGSTGFGYLW